MKFENLKMGGFKCFSTEQEINFVSGFNFLTGENKKEPRLGKNGAGKSTIWDTLTWVLFGKTTRGLKAGDVVSWNTEIKTFVEVTISKNGKKYIIKRTFKPNTLSLNDRAVTQQDIDIFLGFDYDSFLNISLMGQFGTYFLDLKPATQLDIFSKALDLDLWLKASKEANKMVKVTTEEEQEIQNKKANIKGKLETVQENIERYEKKVSSFEVERKRELKELEKELAETETELLEAEKKRDSLLEEYNEFLETEPEYNKQDELQEELEALKKKRIEQSTDIGGHNKTVRWAEEEIRKIKKLGAKCYNCKQDISDEHKQEYIDKREANKREAEEELYKINVTVKRIDVLIKEIEDKIEYQKQEEIKFRIEKDKLERDISSSKREVKHLDSVSIKVVSEITKITEAENPYTEMVVKDVEKTAILEQQIETLDEETEELLGIKKQFEYWVDGYKDIRLWVVETALKQLELEVNNSLVELGLD